MSNVVKKGMSSEAVTGISEMLGLDPYVEFDDSLEDAVKHYQKHNHLQVDGIVGVETLSCLVGKNFGFVDQKLAANAQYVDKLRDQVRQHRDDKAKDTNKIDRSLTVALSALAFSIASGFVMIGWIFYG